ncbi:MAG TPA: sulfotransferase domain-containing protein [Kineosporiaceae bacterium]
MSHAGAGMLTADLARHPQLCRPAGQPAGYFHPLRYGRPVDVHPHDYDRHFTGWSGQRYRLETSPDYFDGGRLMAQALSAVLPDVRVILLLRDPAHRLWTSYADKLARGRLPAAITFDTFVDRCLALRANGADRFEGNRHFRVLSSGFYIEYVPSWLDVFGDRLRVVFTEDLQEDPAAGVRALFEWLRLDPAQAVPPPDADDPAEGYPAPEAPTPAGRRFWPAMPRRSGGRRLPEAAGMSPRAPRQSERARARTRALYAGANQELAGLLQEGGLTALPGWLAASEV